MGWTKRQYIESAYEEIGLASYLYDLTAEQLNSALRRLNSMMANWNANGVRIGWPIPATADGSDLDTDAGAPDVANDAIYLNLAVRLAPSHGKTLSVDTKVTPPTPERQFPNTLPRGQGTKPWRTINSSPFMPIPDDKLATGEDNYLDFE
jgi:hypothetical protein